MNVPIARSRHQLLSPDHAEHATSARGATALLSLLAEGLRRTAAREDSGQEARLALRVQQFASGMLEVANELEAAS